MLKNPLTYLFLTVIACLIIVTGCEKEALTVPQTSPKAITKFNFEGAKNPALGKSPTITNKDSVIIGEISEGNKTVHLSIPFDVDLRAFVPVISVSKGATISPASGEAVDFRPDVKYTITGSDGTVSVYTVIVAEVKPSTSTSLAIAHVYTKDNKSGKSAIFVAKADDSVDELKKVLPAGFDRTKDSLELSFTTPTVATLKEGENEIVLDKKTHKAAKKFSFSSSLSRVFTVTSEDKEHTKKYMLTVVERTNTSNGILIFSLLKSNNSSLPEDIIGVIDESNSTIMLGDLRAGVKASALVPTIEYSGDSIFSKAAKEQDFTFNKTAKEQDFTEDVMYKVKSSNGTEKSYTVKAPQVLPYSGDGFSVQIKYKVLDEEEEGDKKTKTIKLNGLNIEDKFTMVLPKDALQSADKKVEMTLSVSKEATLKEGSTDIPLKNGSFSRVFDFSTSSSKEFIVTSKAGKEAKYTVELKVQGNATKEILGFVFLGVDNPTFYNKSLKVIGVIDTQASTITATVPQYTNVAELTPVIVHNGTSISSEKGRDKKDFRDVKGKKYTVTASDKTTKEYTVIVQETR